jgi:hypothetical protein
MIKQLVLSSLFATMFVGPALADTPRAPSPTMLQIGLKLDSGRHYAMKLIDDHCGRVTSKATTVEDNIKICAHDDGTQVRLDVDWWTRDGNQEVRNDSVGVVAHGSSFDLDGGTAKLTVSLK